LPVRYFLATPATRSRFEVMSGRISLGIFSVVGAILIFGFVGFGRCEVGHRLTRGLRVALVARHASSRVGRIPTEGLACRGRPLWGVAA
jgi:hypothetical protein